MDNVIYLEVDEEITSVIDKLKRSKSPVIGIVAPRNAVLLQSIVNLKLLKKEADKFGKEIALVTADPVGQNLALRTGITVYANVHDTEPLAGAEIPRPGDIIEANDAIPSSPPNFPVHNYRQPPEEKEAIEPPEPAFTSHALDNEPTNEAESPAAESETTSLSDTGEEPTTAPASPGPAKDKVDTKHETPPTPSHPAKDKLSLLKPHLPFWKRRIFRFALIGAIPVVALLAAAAYYAPKATIALTLPTEPFKQDVEITVENNRPTVDSGSYRLPGRLIESAQETTRKVQATGKKNVGQKAKGTITVTNETGIDQSFEANTAFHNNNLIFRADKAFTVPKATATIDPDGEISRKNGTINVAVTADEPGEAYNIAAASFTISGYSKVYGQGSAMTGGLTKEVTVVKQEDIDNGAKDISQSLYKKGEDDLKKKASNATILSKGIKNEITGTAPSAKVGDEVNEFDLKVNTKSSTLSYDADNFDSLIATILKTKIPEGKTLVGDSKEPSIKDVVFDTQSATMKIQVSIDADTATVLNEQEIKQSLSGKTKDEVSAYFQDKDEVSEVKVELFPNWWLKKIPKLANRIEIKTEYSRSNQNPDSSTPSPTPSQ